MKKPLVISSTVALLIILAAMSTLAVVAALAGQKHGQDCANVAHVTNPSLCDR
jgi:hypothetical protein